MNERSTSLLRKAEDAGASSRRYSAFISYTDADRAKAIRLQSRLENYRLPKRLAAEVGFDRIKPVFVDRAEMRASPALDDAIAQALDRSDFLIVLCTPHTPSSRWVGREIDAFREVRGDGNILVALAEGEMPQSCHPRLLTNGHEPLAADFRKAGDGYRLALLKLMAVLVDVDLDDLIHRDERRHRHRLMLAGAIGAILVLLFGGLAFATYRSSMAVTKGRVQAAQAMERQLNDLRAEIRAGGTLDMAAAVNNGVELYYAEQEGKSDLPEIDMGRAQLLHAKAEDAEKRGNLSEAEAFARSAWAISNNVLERRPTNLKAKFVHSQSAYWLAFVAWRKGDTPLAANAFAQYARLADELVKAAPGDMDYRMEQGYAKSNLGSIAMLEAGDTDSAERYFTEALAAFREVSLREPDNPTPVFEAADGEGWLADVEAFRDNFPEARRHRIIQEKMVDQLLAKAPRNLAYRTDKLSSQLGLARIDASQGLYRSALARLKLAAKNAGELLALDPDNASIASRKRIIDLYTAQTELDMSRNDRSAIARSRAVKGDCLDDWQVPTNAELSAFCSLIEARTSLLEGKPQRMRALMAEPRVRQWTSTERLSPRWRIDFTFECGKLGRPELCR